MTGTPRALDLSCLVPMDLFEGIFPVRVDLLYARAEHPENRFGAIYAPHARLWAHRDLAAVALKAAKFLFETQGWTLVVKDSLRPVEAQARMQESPIVRQNPWWQAEGSNRLLSPPGRGAHPRGMAIDVAPETQEGESVPMGTVFDFLPRDPACNPAARNYPDLPEICRKNRQSLEQAMCGAAESLGMDLVALPQEWWDFRFPPGRYEAVLPLYDRDLPAWMRMMDSCEPTEPPPEGHLETLKREILDQAA